jgi:hypothetical protein
MMARRPIAAVCHSDVDGAATEPITGGCATPPTSGSGAALSMCTTGSSLTLKSGRAERTGELPGVDRDDLIGGEVRCRDDRQRRLRQDADAGRLHAIRDQHRTNGRRNRGEQFLDVAEQRIGAAAGGGSQRRDAVQQSGRRG